MLTRSVRDTAAFYREAERIWRNRRLLPVGAATDPPDGDGLADLVLGYEEDATNSVYRSIIYVSTMKPSLSAHKILRVPRCRVCSPTQWRPEVNLKREEFRAKLAKEQQ